MGFGNGESPQGNPQKMPNRRDLTGNGENTTTRLARPDQENASFPVRNDIFKRISAGLLSIKPGLSPNVSSGRVTLGPPSTSIGRWERSGSQPRRDWAGQETDVRTGGRRTEPPLP